MKKILIVFILAFVLTSCDSVMESPEVAKCNKICEESKSLQRLGKKVVYKPIKLCKKRCAATEGTCSKKGAKQSNPRACIYFGMNAGSMKTRTSGSLLKINP
ncbi:MAG: hypothetical protein QNL04_07245 [SAR324 cluster bacterium]|nr:hypothetical protein [SAR324 cluster bacterium]